MKEKYRFLLYNIRYGAGSGWRFHTPVPFSGLVKNTQKNIPGIIDFIKSQDPDLIGLIEVDGGSRRVKGVSQARQIADGLGHYYYFKTKYKENPRMTHHIPIMKTQGNAFLAKEEIFSQRCHYFERGFKRLIIEVELENIIFFIVHLSLTSNRRRQQLKELSDIVNACKKPVVIGGDFNVFLGNHELDEFLSSTRLKSANHANTSTFPSRNPRWELDYVLLSPEITVNSIEVPRIRLSDHLPLICDFSITN